MRSFPFPLPSLPDAGRVCAAALLGALLLSGGCADRGGDEREKTLETSPEAITVPPFNGARAFRHLVRQVEFGPRNPNSPGHAACLAYLRSEMQAGGAEVTLQEFTREGYGGEVLRLTNIVARFHPRAVERILLCAHWDTRPRADRDPDPARREQPIPGANDGASGVAVLLELAFLLRDHVPPCGVDIVLFDGEDYGREGDLDLYLLGSRHYARTLEPDRFPSFGILLDMVGDSELRLPVEPYSRAYAPDIVDLVWGRARALGVDQFVEEEGPAVQDDHLPLNEAGLKTVNIIDFAYPDATHRYWHTHADTPEHCSPGSLEAVGSVIAHIVFTGAH
ncbi:MAG: M28 family peptidase [Bacteroidota bacterium]